MARATIARLGALLCGVVSIAYGCSDFGSPTTPVADVPQLVLSEVASAGPVAASVLRRTVALPSDIVVRQVISTSGGAIRIDQAGLTVSFPKGALPSRTTITVIAHRGDLVAYTFAPHGLVFRNSVGISQRLRYTSAYKNTEATAKLEGGYLAQGTRDIDSSGVALVAEMYPVELSSEIDPFDGRLTPSLAKFSVSHFSGYMLASGRKEVDSTTTKVTK